jgi:hypothetical protein
MTRQEFLFLIRHPEDLLEDDVSALRNITERFPYFTAARLLYTFGLYKENDLDFSQALRRAVASAPSRKKIKLLIDNFRMVHETDTPIQDPDISNMGLTPEIETDLETADEVDVESLEMVPEGSGFPETDLVENVQSGDMQEKRVTSKQDAPILTREELIEKFIREEPRISAPRASFFNPSEKAVHSNIDDDEIVSETLALLYYNQGNAAKAIRIYEKLCLLYPEKSNIFAARIKEMK